MKQKVFLVQNVKFDGVLYENLYVRFHMREGSIFKIECMYQDNEGVFLLLDVSDILKSENVMYKGEKTSGSMFINEMVRMTRICQKREKEKTA